MPSSLLQATELTFFYGATPVISRVSIALAPGDMLAVAGPNGSGKTTLLRLLSGILHPTSGEVQLDGIDLQRIAQRSRARNIAVVPQHLEQHLGFDVETVVELGRTAYSRLFFPLDDVDRDAVTRAMDATEVTELRKRYFSDLSGGEQQRVMLAMALAQETRFLLLDEPTVHLDLRHQRDLLELLVRLRAQRNLGVFAVMHDLNLSALYFDRLALMHQGALIADGDPEKILGDDGNLSIFGTELLRGKHPQRGTIQLSIRRDF